MCKDPLKEVLTIAGVASEYVVSAKTVATTIDRGRLEAVQSGSTWLVRRKDADRRWRRRPTPIMELGQPNA